MGTEFIAHIRQNEDGSWAEPHMLLAHLEGTACLAERFSSKFDSGAWGRTAGLAHDAGKGRLLWLNYIHAKTGYDIEAHLEEKSGKIPHAIHGAELVERLFGKGIGRLLAYCIAGHHAGLPDWSGEEESGRASLQFQKSQVKDMDQIDSGVIASLQRAKPSGPPWRFANGLDISLWIRMLFSCLVDADFLDTEAYMNAAKSEKRGGYCSISELRERLNRYSQKLIEQAADTKVNRIRQQVRAKCIQSASDGQGIFSLTVPTGGGKTLSGLAFALEHACTFNLDRVIYVTSYTSITEQTADVFREAVGADQVVEHHSGVGEEGATIQSRLASENWDAPLIVTTSVQFFESLFASKPSRCRKLHNMARSVVILDEAQLMPVEFLAPILEAIRLLAERYHTSFVISTATQPAFQERVVDGTLWKGLPAIREIMGGEEDIRGLFQALTRCRIHLPRPSDAISEWEEIAEQLKRYNQVLCIVSDRESCRELHRLMPKGSYHLSALMCGQHRSDAIKEIKRKLKEEALVRVISTQLVEAGVDLDFPVVYRALAGLDAIAQAAGRCNREDRLPEFGQVVVFNPPKQAPQGILRKAAETTRSLVAGKEMDIANPAIFETFFEELYWKAESLDKEGIVALLDPCRNDIQECSIGFRTAARKFRIIDDSTQKTVLVRYKDGNGLIDALKAAGPDRSLMRKLQRYTVTLYDHQFAALMDQGALEEVQPNLFALSRERYSEELGVII